MKKFEEMKRAYNTIMKNNIVGDFSEVYVSAITSDFDRLFELSWKTIKEYLRYDLGIQAARTGSPKEILGIAFQQGIIKNDILWLEMLNARNDDTHLYEFALAQLYKSDIETKYLPAIGELIMFLSELIPEETLANISIPDSIIKAANEANVPLANYVRKIMSENGISRQQLDTYAKNLDNGVCNIMSVFGGDLNKS